MTKPKFKKDDRVQYIGAMLKREGKVLMVNSAVPGDMPAYDIMISGDVYTVHETFLRPLMSDTALAMEVAKQYAQAQVHLQKARDALKKARTALELDGQPDYETRMVDEFEIVLKNTLRFELTNEVNRWNDIVVDRKKLN